MSTLGVTKVKIITVFPQFLKVVSFCTFSKKTPHEISYVLTFFLRLGSLQEVHIKAFGLMDSSQKFQMCSAFHL